MKKNTREYQYHYESESGESQIWDIEYLYNSESELEIINCTCNGEDIDEEIIESEIDELSYAIGEYNANFTQDYYED